MDNRKRISLIIALFLVVINVISPSQINAYEDYDLRYIKVGLTRALTSKNEVRLNGENFSVEKIDGQVRELFKINSKDIVVKSKDFGINIEISKDYFSYEEALRKANQLREINIDAKVAYDNGFKVWIGEFRNVFSANEYLAEKKMFINEETKARKNNPVVSIEKTNGETVLMFDKGQEIYLKSLDGIIKLENKRYREYITFINKESQLLAINYISIRDYLKGVVPAEMPASWHIEALKAQAVSARTYTLLNINKHSNLEFDICDSTHCQVYDGYDREHINTNRAVEETRSKVLKYNGELAKTFYSSCSGGYTASNEEVWNGEPIPYLRGKEDIFSMDTPHSNWVYTITRKEASQKLKVSGVDVGEILEIETRKDSSGVRVVELVVTGSKGREIILKDRLRAIFGYNNIKSTNYELEFKGGNILVEQEQGEELYILSDKNTHPAKGSLDGLNVVSKDYIGTLNTNLTEVSISDGMNTRTARLKSDKIVNNNIISDEIVFRGKGWGHGVGMSQHGAANMAKLDYKYTDILEFYYTGAKVE